MKKEIKNIQAWIDGDLSFLELSRQAERTPQGAGYYYLKVVRDRLKAMNVRLHE